MKKTIAILLIMCLMGSVLCGCGSTEIRSYSDEQETEQPRDMSDVYAAYDPKTIVMKVGNDEITWQEYFYWLNSCVLSLDNNNGSKINDWNEECSLASDGQSWGKYVFDSVNAAILQYHVMNQKAAELGVSISDEDIEKLENTLKNDISTYCGADATEEDFVEYLGTMYMTKEYYDYVNNTAFLYYDSFDMMFGENGEKCSDADALSYAEENNYMTADHILISTLDDEGEEISAEELSEKEATAQNIANQLKGITDKNTLLAKFKQLKDEYTDDPGSKNYPNGYCFTDGQMVDEFKAACENLNEYEVSSPVKSRFGYHIIIKLPTTADDEVTYVSEDKYETLRYYAAVDQFDAVVSGWMKDAQYEMQGDFVDLNIAALMGKSK